MVKNLVLFEFWDRLITDTLGHYGYFDVKTIVSQAETLSTEDRGTGWVLSHELAHFSLDWKKYENKIMDEAVHRVEQEYRTCQSYDTTLTNCTFLLDYIKTPSGKTFPVMSPEYVIKTAEIIK